MKNLKLADKLNITPAILLFISIGLLFVAYWGGLTELVSRWEKQEEYGHGFFIPLITLWFLWRRKEALIAAWGEGSSLGLMCVLTGVSMLILGEISAIYILIQYGFLVSLVGVVLTSGGLRLTKIALMPILFLVFAIPLPYFVDAQLSWKLQLLSSQIGVGILRLFGTAVFLEGNVIDLGLYKLQVVDACSGLRYLYPLLSIGFLIAYMYQAKLWQRGVVFLSTIPITILMNSLRIAAVGFLVNQWGSEMADGFLHYFEGWIIFMVCLLILLAEVKLFEYFVLNRPFYLALDLPELKVSQTQSCHHQVGVLQWITLLSLFLAVLFVYSFNGREEVKPSRLPLSAFPLTLDAWKASELSLDKNIESALGFDDYVLADYVQSDSDLHKRNSINFYVAYYSSQRKGVSPHSPQVCMPGGGWIITSLTERPVKVSDTQPFVVNRAVITREHSRQLVYYWFDQRGRKIANEYWMKWYLLADSITKNRTDGALVRITTLLENDESLEDADARLAHFMQSAVPKLPLYVPE